jgi:hypothetical protein
MESTMNKLHGEDLRDTREVPGDLAHDIGPPRDRIDEELRTLRLLVASMLRESGRHQGDEG